MFINPEYRANQKNWYHQYGGWDEQMKSDQKAADAQIELDEASEIAARNQATAERQNAAARMPRQNARAGGTRYTRRGMWKPGGSGLTQANAAARTAARKKAAYAGIEKKYDDKLTDILSRPAVTSITPLGFFAY